MSELSDKPIIILGAGGHCRSVIDVVRAAGRKIEGILERPETSTIEVDGIRVIGNDEDISKYVGAGAEFLIGLGDLGLPDKRIRLFNLLMKHSALLATVVSTHAYFSPRAEISKGSIVMHHAFVNANVRAGINTVINTGSIIEHDVRLGDHVQVAPGAVINGGVIVGDRTYIGSGAIIREGVSIAADTVIGMGAVVVRDIEEPGTYLGIPAKRIKNPRT